MNKVTKDFLGLLKFFAQNHNTSFYKQKDDVAWLSQRISNFFLQRTYQTKDQDGQLIVQMPGMREGR
jgi:hypothetical protein